MEQLTFDVAPKRRLSGARIDDDGRECGECRSYKPWDQFHISRTTRHGHVTTCKPCTARKAALATAVRQAQRPPRARPACTRPKCTDLAVCRTWCEKHYERWRRYGDPDGPQPEPRDDPDERWLPIPTLADRYEVSDKGRVYALQRETASGRIVGGRFLKPDITPKGYLRVGLVGADGRQRNYSVHRLVLWAFTDENPADLDTRHMDGNPGNNALGNLAFGTASDNAHDRVRHGTWVNNNRFVGATECIHGHEFNEANTYWRPTGGRSCRACQRDTAARRRAAVRTEREAA